MVKIALHFNLWIGGVALLVLSGGAVGRAETPPRPRGNPIIFSGPKSDLVSSNLNELRAPASPFRDMESTLKKPFELFEPGKSGMNSSPVMKSFTPPPQPELNKKPLKAVLHERAEEMFLDPTLHAGETDDDLFKSAEDSVDPYTRKPKNALDRYYDRMDRALTNRAATADGLGVTPDFRNPLSPDPRNPFAGSADAENQRNPAGNKSRPFASPNEAKRDGMFGERSFLNQRDSGMPVKPDSYYSTYREQKVDRLDTFKRLLQGPGATRGANPLPGGPYATTPARSPAYAAPTTTGSGYTGYKPASTAVPAHSFAKSAGLVGTPATPQGVPDYAASASSLNSSPTTPPAKPVAPPTFSIPKRRF